MGSRIDVKYLLAHITCAVQFVVCILSHLSLSLLEAKAHNELGYRSGKKEKHMMLKSIGIPL